MISATEKYGDIIRLEHHVSKKRPQMPISDRAAQFAPFAALKGYDETIEETARVTEEFLERDEGELALVNEKLVLLKMREREHPEIKATYFEPDAKKEGGAYRTLVGRLKRVDGDQKRLQFEDGTGIPFDCLVDLVELS